MRFLKLNTYNAKTTKIDSITKNSKYVKISIKNTFATVLTFLVLHQKPYLKVRKQFCILFIIFILSPTSYVIEIS